MRESKAGRAGGKKEGSMRGERKRERDEGNGWLRKHSNSRREVKGNNKEMKVNSRKWENQRQIRDNKRTVGAHLH